MGTAIQVAEQIRNGQLSPSEVLDECLSRVDAIDPELNGVIWRNDEDSRERARVATERAARSDPADLPPFFGVPIPIKDLTRVKGWPVTYGSSAVPETPSDESDLVVDALMKGGFLLTARTNTPEFGPITAAENDRYGLSRNPWDPNLTPGGSSGGAGVVVAGRMFPAAHGNDGGGSIRIPASCCGLVGLKVSRGRVPGFVTSWEGGAVEGVLTRDVADTAALLGLISGPDTGCWYNAPAPARPFSAEVGVDPGRLRVGLLTAAPLDLPVDPAFVQAVESAATLMADLGHDVILTKLELPDEVVGAFMNVINSGLADYEDVDWEKAEPHIRAARETGRAIDSLAYVSSVHELQRFTRSQVARWGSDFDVMLTPTMAIEPPAAGEILRDAHENPGVPPLRVLQMAVFCSPFNVSGQPAISLPLAMSSAGVPIGVQLVGGPWGEASLLRLASQLEQASPWGDLVPDGVRA